MSRPRYKPIVYKLEKDNHFVSKVSTNTTDEIPNVVFLRTKVRITPLELRKTYEKEIKSLKRAFEEYSKRILDNSIDYDGNYIFTVDISEKSVKYKKTSHLRYDLFLKPKHNNTLLEHKYKLHALSLKLDNKLVELFKTYRLLWK